MRRIVVLTLMLAVAAASSASAAAWTVQSTPNPTGASSSELVSVSCGSNSGCIAVGSSTSAAGKVRALAERWHGGTWTIARLPTLSGSPQTALTGVACISATACTAVGVRITHGGRKQTLAERWNGSHWTVQATPNPSSALPIHELTGVACSSVRDCVAVGYLGRETFSPVFSATFSALIARWNGHHWSVQHVIPAATGATNRLVAVSCRIAAACVAVGDASSVTGMSGPLAWRWDGHRWRNLHPPNHGEFAGLLGVSCSAVSSCTAVGHFFVSRDQENIAEHWNGSVWRVRTPPRPQFAGAAQLSGVSCRSASRCVAVGAAGPADPTGGEAALWDGSHWTVQATPGGDGWPLEQVSCRPAFCVAVGFHGRVTLAERYG